MSEDLVLQCLSLPLAERRTLMEKIVASIRVELTSTRKISSSADVLKVMASICKVMGLETLPKDRHKRSVFARQAVIHTLREFGDSLPAIGKVMGMHHSTILHNLTEFDYKLSHPNMFREEMNLYKRYIEELNNETE